MNVVLYYTIPEHFELRTKKLTHFTKEGKMENTETSKGGEELTMDNKMMTVQEVASLLRISRFSVYNLVKRGELSAVKVLNKLRFPPIVWSSISTDRK